MEKLIHISDSRITRELFGAGDRNMRFFEDQLGVRISVRPQGILVRGTRTDVQKTDALFKKIFGLAREGIYLKRDELAAQLAPSGITSPLKTPKLSPVSTPKNKGVFPKTEGQKKYVKAIENYDIIVAIGPAGTGKTYLAMAMAVQYLMAGKVRRIILTRPAIEAGESLGFLPGGMSEKLGPYLKPLYDALYDMMEAETIETHLETGVIEIAPLAYMRGRTLNDAFIILDEAQNCTSEQLKMFLTRLGFHSRTVITGDITQSDLPGGKPKGLLDALSILKPIRGIKSVQLTNKDVVRHPLIQKIIKAYENFYNKAES